MVKSVGVGVTEEVVEVLVDVVLVGYVVVEAAAVLAGRGVFGDGCVVAVADAFRVTVECYEGVFAGAG